MKSLFNILLIMTGVCGAAVAFLSDIVVSSSLEMINGMNLSILLGVFSILVVVAAFVNLFSTD